ncbi:hypothetical protein MNBD_GAMMA11-2245 [hydrothermal vent metagenome]|uniref:Uncharacterized protein n=1 Tax=hydrothermal vent metagenome TaxID=652676 RepID=A0A3B0XBN4_9ZZZZ
MHPLAHGNRLNPVQNQGLFLSACPSVRKRNAEPEQGHVI